MKLIVPNLTHQQILFLEILRVKKKLFARELVVMLKEIEFEKSGPSFYQFMDRLSGSGLVKKTLRTGTSVSGQYIRESSYEVTQRGIKALKSVKTFYSALFK